MKKDKSMYFCISEGAVFANSKANAESKFPRGKRKQTHCSPTGIKPVK